MQNEKSIRQAIQILGGYSAAARALAKYSDGKRRKSVTRQRVHQWDQDGRLPGPWVHPLAVASGIPRFKIDPYLYPVTHERIPQVATRAREVTEDNDDS